MNWQQRLAAGLVLAALSALLASPLLVACAGSGEPDPAPAAPPATERWVACFCPERSGTCGSWHAQTGACDEYRGHSALCAVGAESCDCGCVAEPDGGSL